YDLRLLLSDADAFSKKKKNYTSEQLREILEETPALDRERYR
ncbi:putative splicing factor, arginine/serine-rich protein 8, partial [Toxoplasma gondii p89]